MNRSSILPFLYFLGAFAASMAAGIQDVMTTTAWVRLVMLSVVAGVTALHGFLRQPPAANQAPISTKTDAV